MPKDNLGDRMKRYEGVSGKYLMRKTPVIMRIDGKAFHTYSKKFNSNEPFNENLRYCMCRAAIDLLAEMQGAKAFYQQSDEVSFLITDMDKIDTDAWFGYNIQKMASVSASLFTGYFNKHASAYVNNIPAAFDSRVFNMPTHDVINYFIWRQSDWFRNSLCMLARFYFSHKELEGKNRADMHDMLHSKGVNWANLDPKWKNGTSLVLPNPVRTDLVFKENRNIFNEFI